MGDVSSLHQVDHKPLDTDLDNVSPHHQDYGTAVSFRFDDPVDDGPEAVVLEGFRIGFKGEDLIEPEVVRTVLEGEELELRSVESWKGHLDRGFRIDD